MGTEFPELRGAPWIKVSWLMSFFMVYFSSSSVPPPNVYSTLGRKFMPSSILRPWFTERWGSLNECLEYKGYELLVTTSRIKAPLGFHCRAWSLGWSLFSMETKCLDHRSSACSISLPTAGWSGWPKDWWYPEVAVITGLWQTNREQDHLKGSM